MRTTIPVGENDLPVIDENVPVLFVDLLQEAWAGNGVFCLSMAARVLDGAASKDQAQARTQVRVRMPLNVAAALHARLSDLMKAAEAHSRTN